jgi:hypothetical protein
MSVTGTPKFQHALIFLVIFKYPHSFVGPAIVTDFGAVEATTSSIGGKSTFVIVVEISLCFFRMKKKYLNKLEQRTGVI